MKVSFDYPDPRMPRTLYYEKLCEQIRKHRDYIEDPRLADVVFPVEDTAIETNWPCYGHPDAAFIRGSFRNPPHLQYLQYLAGANRQTCIVNMHPSIRVPQYLASTAHIIVADINLRSWERSINPRTISMPALPLTVGRFDRDAKRIFASFRGVDSDPTRSALQRLNDGTTYVCELVKRSNHVGTLEAGKSHVDAEYFKLLNESVFAFVPRGDSEFSYRLLEVMSFGCIPIVFSDGLVLPFDRSIDWPAVSLHVPEKDVARIPQMLETFPHRRIDAMQIAVNETYARCLSGFGPIVQTLLAELTTILKTTH